MVSKKHLLVLSAGSIGMIVTPGGIGAYAYLLEKTMQLVWFAKRNCTGIWLDIMGCHKPVVILIGGLFSFVAMPYFNKKKQLKRADLIPEKIFCFLNSYVQKVAQWRVL